MESFTSISIGKGLFITDIDFLRMYDYGRVINGILSHWMENEHDYLLLFIKTVKEIAMKGTFSTFFHQSPFSSFVYAPKKKRTITVKIRKICINILKSTDILDFKKISTAYVANFIHFGDSTLVALFYKKLKNLSLYGFTIHDRFFMHPAQSPKLYKILQEIYVEYYKLDLFEKFFENEPEILKLRPEKGNVNYLHAHNLLNANFVKK